MTGATEHGHNRVTDELLHRATERLELRAEAGVVRPDPGLDVLWVRVIGRFREPDQVAEEDGHDFAFLSSRRDRLGKGGRAYLAEPGPVRVLLAAARTGFHRAESLWRGPPDA